jgi:hypothetical protein
MTTLMHNSLKAKEDLYKIMLKMKICLAIMYLPPVVIWVEGLKIFRASMMNQMLLMLLLIYIKSKMRTVNMPENLLPQIILLCQL